ncbi:MAG: gliding motility-associated C-terminal domain-containing protein [Phaeodactylibacter sp.]|uniref:T9SS type B sorting domain-containing protein n=1 Tax=Phaeodactylibacter sp. TaxID=1940289 RepID=UPI0032EBDBF6
MKKYTFSLALCFFFFGALSLQAQNVAYTMYFEQPEEPPCLDEEICINVTVQNFSNIATTDFNILWDSTAFEFVQVTGFNLPGLSAANFTETSAGSLNTMWEVEDCSTINDGEGVTLDDCDNTCRPVIFQLCLRAIGTYGSSTSVTVGPDRYTTKDNSNCVNTQTFVEPAFVSTCVRPFIIDIGNSQGNEGDLVCLDFSVSGLDSLSSFQFPVVWDSTLASFESVIIPQNLPNFGPGNIGNPISAMGVQEGSITVSWGAPPPANLLSLADSTLIFQLCLRLKPGSCSRDLDVFIADQQPGQPFFRPEATNDFMNGFSNIQVGQNPGVIEVGTCNPEGVQVVANCGDPVTLNDQVCVAVEAGGNFQNVTDLGFLMQWNTSILEYTGVQGFNLPGLNGTGFNELNTQNGVLGFEWDGSPQTRAEGDVIFEVCFDVIGLGGNSPFQFINNNADVGEINNGGNIGINPTNCEVTVNQPPGVVMELTGDLQGQPGDTLCFDFMVNNFVDVEEMQFSIVWEPEHLEFLLVGGLQNINLPGASAANFNFISFQNGQILFDNWAPSSPVTLPDGTSLFTLCFQIPDDEALAGICDVVQIASDPLVAEVITSSSNNEDVGLSGIGGDYCILSPDGFWLVGGQVEGDLRDTVCVPFQVGQFEDITGASFCVNWAPGSLNFTEFIDPGLIPNLNFNLDAEPVGAACIDFTSLEPLLLADSAVIFEMCFELLGPADTCYAISVNEIPSPTVSTGNGPGSLLDLPAELCINDKLFIDTAIVTAESCPGVCDGEVQLVVSGGVPPYAFSWQTSPPQFGNTARFLCSGEVIVTILDNSGLSLTDTITVPVGGFDLFVDVGPDRVAKCSDCSDANFISATATTINENPNVVYEWTASQGGQICGATDSRFLLAIGPGSFILEVRDDSSGCVVQDTLLLTPPVLPDVGAIQVSPQSAEINCNNPAVSIAVDSIDNVDYLWSGPNDFTADTHTIMASDSGTYVLTVSFIDTGCSITDSTTIDVDINPPFILASPGTDSVFVGCNDAANLNGFVAGDVLDFTARWLDMAGTEVANGESFSTITPGTYFFEVTNNENGCTALDSTVVSTEAELPMVMIEQDPPPAINCNGTEVQLNAVVTNANPNAVQAEWTSPDGGQLEPGTEDLLTPTVIVPGTFNLTITDEATGCTATDMVMVNYDTIPPAAIATVDGLISCDSETALLDGSASGQGPNVTYNWRSLSLGDVSNNITEPVGAPGLYVLTVRDTLSGCVATDTVLVVQDTLPPVVMLTPAQNLNCNRDTVSFAASVDLDPGTFTVDWGSNISIIENDTIARVTEAGTYTITVTNDVTGCETMLTREVDDLDDEPEIVLASDQLSLDCITNQVTLDATGSTVSDSLVTVQYQWSSIEGTLISPLNGQTVQTDEPGIYVLTLTNVVSNCAVTDTVVVEDNQDTPTAVVVENQLQLDCLNPTGTLDGTGSSTGDNLVYIWQVIEGGAVVDTLDIGPGVLTTTVTNEGIYRLRVLNTTSGCSAGSAPVQVNIEGEVPEIVFGAPTDIGLIDYDCNAADTIEVEVSLANDSLFGANDLVYEWSAGVVFDGDVNTVGILEPGIYTLMVTDTTTGCVGENEIVVNDIREFPVVQFANESPSLTCTETTIALDASGSTFLPDTTVYSWMDIDGMELGTDPTLEVTTPGMYQFMVTNTITGCSTVDTIMVGEDTNPPSVVQEAPEDFTCISEDILISAAPTGDANDFTTAWSVVDGGGVVPNDGTLTANVDAPGTYQLTLTSNLNGCDSTVVFEVAADTTAPEGEIAMPDFLGCAGQNVTLDASTYGNNGDFDIEWTTTAGTVSPATGSFLVDVDAAGTYFLSVTDPTNGCEAMDTVAVELDPETPIAVGAAPDNILGCGDTLTLDGTGSSEGMIYDYEWVATGGMGLPPVPVTNLTATVDAVGDYLFIVTNTNTGCSDTSEVVSILPDDSLPDALAQVDSVFCDGFAFISANLPDGFTGQWTVNSGLGTLESDTLSATQLNGLGKEVTELTWTLSQEGCPDFSSSSITVVPQLAPEAANDIMTVDQGNNQAQQILVSNDILTGVPAFTFALTDQPTLGTATDQGDGEVSYTLTSLLFGPAQDAFGYVICNADCPTLCDSASVEVQIQRDSMEIETPNGITPNGDGLNESLVFDQLLLNPDKYQNNELIIFNRWGDIVFEAAPYSNNWEGQNMDGSNLPDGTYYYILRLDIGGGEILRGDVTILR